MTLGVPLAAALAVLSVPVVLAFLNRRRTETTVVSSVEIFRVLSEKRPQRSRFAVLRHLVGLLLTLLALLFGILALMEPSAEEEGPRAQVIVLDTSASMGATDSTGASHFQRAVDAVDTLAEGLGSRDRVALITMGTHAAVDVGLTTGRGPLEAWLDGALSPAGEGRSEGEALALAVSLCEGGGGGVIHWFSDRSAPTAERVPEGCAVIDHGVSPVAPLQNVGIVGLSVREADALGLSEVFVAVESASAVSRTFSVELALDGKLVDLAAFEVEANGRDERLLRLTLPEGDALEARIVGLEGPDALDEDNVAYVPVTAASRVRGLLVTDRPESFLGEALRLHPRLDLEVVEPSAVPAGSWDLLVLEALPPALPSASHILSFGVDPTPLGVSWTEVVAEPEIVRWSFDSPLFRYVDLGGVNVAGGRHLRLPDDAVSLVDSPAGVLAASVLLPDAEAIVFGFGALDSDLVLRIGFVNFLANVVEWAAPKTAVGGGWLPTGTRPALADGQQLVSADGRALPAGTRVTEPGVYRVVGADGASTGKVMASLLSTHETAIPHGVSDSGSPSADLEGDDLWSRILDSPLVGLQEALEALSLSFWKLAAVLVIGLVLFEGTVQGLVALMGGRFRRRRVVSEPRTTRRKKRERRRARESTDRMTG